MQNKQNQAESSFAFASKRYYFSLLNESHRDFYQSLYTDEIVMQKIATPLDVKSVSGLFQHVLKHSKLGKLNQSTSLSWIICDAYTHEFVGIQGFIQNPSNRFEAEFGIMLLPSNYQKGIATESICALLKYGFTEMEFSKLYASYRAQNIAVQRIAENLGLNIAIANDPQQPEGKYCWLTKQQFVKCLHLFERQ